MPCQEIPPRRAVRDEFPHPRPQPAARLRRGHARAQRHPRGGAAGDDPAGGQQRPAAAARGDRRRAVRHRAERRRADGPRRRDVAARRGRARAAAARRSTRRASIRRATRAPSPWRWPTRPRPCSMPALIDTLLRERALADVRVLPLVSRDPRPQLEQGVADIAVGFFPDVAAALAAEGDAGDDRPRPALHLRIRRRDAPRPCAGGAARALARRLLRRPPCAGQLRRPAARLRRRGAGARGPGAADRC